MSDKKPAAEVTLIRGRHYYLVHPFNRRLGSYNFIRGQAMPINDPEVAAHIESLKEDVRDSDDEIVSKPIFSVDWSGTGAASKKGAPSRKTRRAASR